MALRGVRSPLCMKGKTHKSAWSIGSSMRYDAVVGPSMSVTARFQLGPTIERKYAQGPRMPAASSSPVGCAGEIRYVVSWPLLPMTEADKGC